MADADAPLAGGVRSLTRIPATLFFCLLLYAVYVVELYVWRDAGAGAFVTLFIARQQPSPGWLLAPLAHSPFDIWHLLSNLFQILAFGAIAELRLHRAKYVAFLVASAMASTGAQVGVYAAAGPAARGLGVLGASGIALALAAFVLVDSIRYYDAAKRWHGETTWIWTFFAGLVVVNALVEAFVGAPGIAVTGHLAGIGLGLTFGLVRPRTAVLDGGRRRFARGRDER